MPKIAKKSNWKTKPMPKMHRVITLDLSFSAEEFQALQKGIIPRQMEDKWFIYFEDNNIYCHRSWTGFCAYIGKFKEVNGQYHLYEVEVNDNSKQYEPQSDRYELNLFLDLTHSIDYYKPDDIVRPITLDDPLGDMEQDFCNYYKELPNELECLYNKLLDKYKLKLNSNEITKTIILRLKTYYETQDKIVKCLNKKSVSPSSDFFVETVVFYLKLLLEQRKLGLEVKSEVRFDTKNGYIKPDISIWKDDKVAAIIECKTNLGFRRNKWESDFKAREIELKTSFPKAKAFLLVLSSKNWSGFDGKDKKAGQKYFALSNTSLRKIKDTSLDDVVENRIEKLFGQILKFD